MKRNALYLIVCLGILFVGQGCAHTVSQIHTNKGTVRVGMSKDEVLSLWGKPYHKWLKEQSTESDMWLYPGKHWWGANQIELEFDENGILQKIELVQD